MHKPIDVEAISLTGRIAILNTGVIVPITKLYDCWGNETDDLNEALTFVCGSGLAWYAGSISDFDGKLAN